MKVSENSPIVKILSDIGEERGRQIERFGNQLHTDTNDLYRQVSRGISTADTFRNRYACEQASTGDACWHTILLEEVAEAIEEACEGDKEKLREELVQVAAVAAAWIEQLDGAK